MRRFLTRCALALGALPAGEPFGLPAGRAALHVDDLAVSESQHLEALLPPAALVHPLGRADDHVVANACEVGPDVESTVAALADLGGQDLTGLVWAVSGRCALPPQVAVRDAAPLALVCDQLRERSGVASVERIRRDSELVDHGRIMTPARCWLGRAFGVSRWVRSSLRRGRRAGYRAVACAAATSRAGRSTTRHLRVGARA
jgi:hypothetical protein